MNEGTHRSPLVIYGMAAHESRAFAVGEVHARPYLLLSPPRGLILIAFLNEGWCISRWEVDPAGIVASDEVADEAATYHRAEWSQGDLRCEKYAEYSTYLWCAPLDLHTGRLVGENPFGHDFAAPGGVVSGVRVDVLPWSEAASAAIARFDPVSLCHAQVEDGMADIATDFHADEEGLTRILILDRGLAPPRLGALAQTLLDIEVSRTLAVLGIPLSRSLASRLHGFEQRLSRITREMRGATGRSSADLLSDLTDLSAELEAETAATLYRFGASRIYYEDLEQRLSSLAEVPVAGANGWKDFLLRRIAPAMQTCRSVQERQANLSRELARAIALLRTRIEVELERQNNGLLTSMNDRAKLQLRLQQTVEGLSVAAISYYVIGLLGHFIEGIPGLHDRVSPALVLALLIPVVILAVWWTVRRIRQPHSEAGSGD